MCPSYGTAFPHTHVCPKAHWRHCTTLHHIGHTSYPPSIYLVGLRAIGGNPLHGRDHSLGAATLAPHSHSDSSPPLHLLLPIAQHWSLPASPSPSRVRAACSPRSSASAPPSAPTSCLFKRFTPRRRGCRCSVSCIDVRSNRINQLAPMQEMSDYTDCFRFHPRLSPNLLKGVPPSSLPSNLETRVEPVSGDAQLPNGAMTSTRIACPRCTT